MSHHPANRELIILDILALLTAKKSRHSKACISLSISAHTIYTYFPYPLTLCIFSQPSPFSISEVILHITLSIKKERESNMPVGGYGPALGPGKGYPGNLTLYVTVTCMVAAMGGLIFGYDIGISGIQYNKIPVTKHHMF